MKTRSALFIFLLALLLSATSSVAQGAGASADYSHYGNPPIPGRILLLVPEEFQHFVYASPREDNKILHPIGRDGERELRAALAIQFDSVGIRMVRSEAAAMTMISPKDADTAWGRKYDYVVIPKFVRVDSSVNDSLYGFDIELSAEFYARDGASVINIGGHGGSSTGIWFALTLDEGFGLAMQYAVSAILDGVEESRSLFASYKVDSPAEDRNGSDAE